MNKRMMVVMQRRGALLARIATQREQVASIGRRWRTPLALADRVLTLAHFLRSKPMLVVSMAAIIAIRRRGVTGIVTAVWPIWKLYKAAVSFSAKIASHSH